MKQTKAAPFMATSIALLALSSIIPFFVDGLVALSCYLDEERYIPGVLVTGFGYVLYDLLPLLILLVGFIFFYKKGKSAAIFGAAFLTFLFLNAPAAIDNLTNCLSIITGMIVGAVFEGEAFDLLSVLATVRLFFPCVIVPLLWCFTLVFGAVSCFCGVKKAKTTIALLAVSYVFDVGCKVLCIVYEVLTKNILWWHNDVEAYINMVPLLFSTLAVIVFLLYRNKAKKDVEAFA